MMRWIRAARLRTLPLALSVCFASASCALSENALNYAHFLLLMATITSLQILSNYANDLGDFENGADDDLRYGPKRQVQSGAIQVGEMKMAVRIFGGISFFLGVTLLIVSALKLHEIVLLFLLGISAIWAAIRYTAGKNPYGYRALGDLSVFLFFGPLGVCGATFLLCRKFSVDTFCLSMVMGCLAMMVLNLNNLRDENQDRRTNKITLIVRWGSQFGLRYNRALFLIAIVFALSASWNDSWIHLFTTLTVFAFLAIAQRKMLLWQSLVDYDKLMKPTAISAFLFSFIHFVLCIFTL